MINNLRLHFHFPGIHRFGVIVKQISSYFFHRKTNSISRIYHILPNNIKKKESEINLIVVRILQKMRRDNPNTYFSLLFS